MSDEERMTATEVAHFHAEALRLRWEATEMLKQAEAKDHDGEYKLGQAEHRLKTVQATEAGFSAREKWLKENKEDELRRLAADAAAKLAEAKTVLAQYHADRHGAARALIAIDAREKAEREAAA